MSNYNLSDNVQDNFTFELRDKKYVMRYPITEEVENIQSLTALIEEAATAKNDDEVKSLSNQLEGVLYGFITPEGHDVPIKKALQKENIRVMRNFNKMIRTELAIQ